MGLGPARTRMDDVYFKVSFSNSNRIVVIHNGMNCKNNYKHDQKSMPQVEVP